MNQATNAKLDVTKIVLKHGAHHPPEGERVTEATPMCFMEAVAQIALPRGAEEAACCGGHDAAGDPRAARRGGELMPRLAPAPGGFWRRINKNDLPAKVREYL